MIKSLKSYLAVFVRARRRVEQQPWFTENWLCQTGWWPSRLKPECVVFKLLRRHWTNDRTDAIRNESGLFFSVWVDEDFAAAGRLHYNIHALKLRKLPGYALESRKFAAAFRAGFRRYRRQWPHVDTDYGPQTLMQGWVEADRADSAHCLVEMAARFLPLADLIETLLGECRKPCVSAER